jgi:5-formyltetrahydrofolate cyclo-ligase
MKTDLRIKAKNIRKTLEIPSISKKIVALIRENKAYIEAKNVMIFYPKKYEIDLRELLDDEKSFFLPRVNGNELDVCPYKFGDELKLSAFNVLEPVSEAVEPSFIDLIIVPALLVDKCGYRLGYGGGYYDRLLRKVENLNVKTLCAMPKELVVEKLPSEEYDIPVKEIIFV